MCSRHQHRSLKVLTEELDLTLKGSYATEFISVCLDACAKFKASPKIAAFQAQMTPSLEGKQPVDDLVASYPTIPHFFEAFPFLTNSAFGCVGRCIDGAP